MPKFQQEFLIEVQVRRERLKETLMQHFAKESKTQDQMKWLCVEDHSMEAAGGHHRGGETGGKSCGKNVRFAPGSTTHGAHTWQKRM